MESLLCLWSEGAQEGNILVPNKAGIHRNSSLRQAKKKERKQENPEALFIVLVNSKETKHCGLRRNVETRQR